jgi:hypothetical protein
MPEDKNRQQLLNEKEELELEKLRAEVMQMRATNEQRREARKDQELAFRDAEQKAANLSRNCNHKKGGRDYASTAKRGDGDNYSIIPHTMPLGETIILCTRCLFIWKPGTSEKFMPDGRTPNPTGIPYQIALRFPTDNSPSGSVLFGIRPQVMMAPEAA